MGIEPQQLAVAIAIGIVGGLGAPGLTLPLQTLLFWAVSKFAGFTLGAPEFAVASAVNLALTVADLWLWNALFMRLGGMLLPPGGKYLRPFVAGLLPWLALSLPSVAVIYQLVSRVLTR